MEQNLVQFMGGRLVVIGMANNRMVNNQSVEWIPSISKEWVNNPGVLSSTHSGLWMTCLEFTGEERFDFDSSSKFCYNR